MPHQGSGSAARRTGSGMGYNRYFDDFETGRATPPAAPWWKGYTYTDQRPELRRQERRHRRTTTAGRRRRLRRDRHEPHLPGPAQRCIAKSRVVYTTMTGLLVLLLRHRRRDRLRLRERLPEQHPDRLEALHGDEREHVRAEHPPRRRRTAGSSTSARTPAAATGGGSTGWASSIRTPPYCGTWAATGNLPTGTGAGPLRPHPARGITSARTCPGAPTFVNAGRRTGPEGSTSFYWNGTANSTFHHVPSDRHRRPAGRRHRDRDALQLPAVERNPDQPPVRHRRQRHGRQPRPLPPDAVRTDLHRRVPVAVLRSLGPDDRARGAPCSR